MDAAGKREMAGADTGDDQTARFAANLTSCLRKRYAGRPPSCSRIARDLALAVPSVPQVSPETVRKWITGKSLPKMLHGQALCIWLGSGIAPDLTALDPPIKDLSLQQLIAELNTLPQEAIQRISVKLAFWLEKEKRRTCRSQMSTFPPHQAKRVSNFSSDKALNIW